MVGFRIWVIIPGCPGWYGCGGGANPEPAEEEKIYKMWKELYHRNLYVCQLKCEQGTMAYIWAVTKPSFESICSTVQLLKMGQTNGWTDGRMIFLIFSSPTVHIFNPTMPQWRNKRNEPHNVKFYSNPNPRMSCGHVRTDWWMDWPLATLNPISRPEAC